MNKTGKTLLEKVLTFYQALLKDESADPVVRFRTAQVCGQVADFRHTMGQLEKSVEAFEQHGKLLATASPYQAAMKLTANPDAFADALTGAYATDPNYGTTLKYVIHTYSLTVHDK